MADFGHGIGGGQTDHQYYEICEKSGSSPSVTWLRGVPLVGFFFVSLLCGIFSLMFTFWYPRFEINCVLVEETVFWHDIMSQASSFWRRVDAWARCNHSFVKQTHFNYVAVIFNFIHNNCQKLYAPVQAIFQIQAVAVLRTFSLQYSRVQQVAALTSTTYYREQRHASITQTRQHRFRRR